MCWRNIEIQWHVLPNMDRKWRHQRSQWITINLLYLIVTCATEMSCATNNTTSMSKEDIVDRELKRYVDQMLSVDEVNILPGIHLERAVNNNFSSDYSSSNSYESSRNFDSVEDYTQKKLQQFSQTHVLSVRIPETARFLFQSSNTESKSGGTFLAGFGMGFLAFFLKKLLLPVFIAAQLLKSVMIAMFLPSILGSLGRIVGKGSSTVSGISGASAGVQNANTNANDVEDFEFKDTSPYENGDVLQDEFAAEPDTMDTASSTVGPQANHRFGITNNRIGSHMNHHTPINDNYYLRRPNKKTDYKVFHKIPASSLLLTSYDPFYSPLLSRLDAVFHQLGLGNDKSPTTEKCRERLVCMMYANPAKYAPYSNLVSAQLSRELNELKKPTSDNPEILRFFRYMKAAKDGQDGEECINHGGCPSLSASNPSPAMLTTFNDINKLVQARKFK